MMNPKTAAVLSLLTALLGSACSPGQNVAKETINTPPPGFTSLFNGKDLSGWKIPEGDNGHWKVLDSVIDYDALSEAPGDKNLWSEESYRNLVLMVDWRLKEPSGEYDMPHILPDGSHWKDAEGKVITRRMPNADSGVYLRGTSKSQLNIWMWPAGSGEIYGYRMDQNQPPEVRAGATPIKRADRRVGEWNTFVITLENDVVTVELNGELVIDKARLPDLPETGPIALQHHGNGKPGPAASLVQFRNIFIKPLP